MREQAVAHTEGVPELATVAAALRWRDDHQDLAVRLVAACEAAVAQFGLQRLEALPGGTRSVVVAGESPTEGPVVVKVCLDHHEAQAEARHLAQLRGRGLPVPAVLAQLPGGTLLLERVAGRPASTLGWQQSVAVCLQALAMERDGAEAGRQGQVDQVLAALAADAAVQPVSARMFDQAAAGLDPQLPRWLHGDLLPKNVLVGARGDLVAVLDPLGRWTSPAGEVGHLLDHLLRSRSQRVPLEQMDELAALVTARVGATQARQAWRWAAARLAAAAAQRAQRSGVEDPRHGEALELAELALEQAR